MNIRNQRLAITLLSGLAYACGAAANAADWYHPAWAHRIGITVPAARVSGDLSSYPLLVLTTNAALRSMDHGGRVGQTNGADILFTSAAGIKLDHEIEQYTPSNGHLVAWVEMPQLSSSTDTEVCLYYGNEQCEDQSNRTGTWDANFKWVLHLNQDPATNAANLYPLIDSSSNAKHAASKGMEASNQAEGRIGKSIDLDGVDDWIEGAGVSASASWTTEYWFKTRDANVQQGLLNRDTIDFRQYISSVNYLSMRVDQGGGDYATLSSGHYFQAGRWDHIVWTYDSATTNLACYVNGNLKNSWSTVTVDSGGPGMLRTGGIASTYGFARGGMDELRISDISRSGDWVATCYTNQFDPAGFCAFGMEEDQTDYADTTPWYGRWNHRRRLMVPAGQIAEHLTNFPLVISETDDALKDVAHGGHVAQTDGGDFVFTKSDGVTRLNHEIEQYGPTNGNLLAWVQVDNLSTAAPWAVELYLYYGRSSCADPGNPAGVWDSNYRMVHHFTNDPSGTAPQMRDSTSYGRDGTTYGSMTAGDQIPGKLNGALKFDGVDDDFLVPSVPRSISWSTEAWIYLHDATVTHALITRNSTDFRQGVYPYKNGMITTRIRHNMTDYSNFDTLTAIGTQRWHHVCWTYDAASNLTAYVDGQHDTTWPNVAMLSGGTGNLLAGWASGFGFLNGRMDEVRYSDVARSGAWIQAAYDNQSSPETFTTSWPEQTRIPDSGTLFMVR